MTSTAFLNAPVPASLAGHVPFVKMHGARNHFVILDRRRHPIALTAESIHRMCDVYEGLGADQVITIDSPAPEDEAQGAVAAMRIFNTDGWEAQACGNATRCVAHLLFDELDRQHILLATKAGLLPCRRTGPQEVAVVLGPIRTGWQEVPLSRPVDTLHLPLEAGPLKDGVALNIGNPHGVFFVEDLEAVSPGLHANAIQKDDLFPEQVNVGMCQVLGPNHLRLQVWERPGMLTQACGTGTCVAAYAAVKRGLVAGPDVRVDLPGGTLTVRLLGDDMVEMTGPVAFSASGYILP